MRVAYRHEIVKIEAELSESYGIPMILLMERAGNAVARRVINGIRMHDNPQVIFICGTGNNGGDGLAAASHVHAGGVKIKVYMCGNIEKASELTKMYGNIIEKTGIRVRNIHDAAVFSEFLGDLRSSHMVVDAMYGVGFRAPMKEPEVRIISELNQAEIPVLSIDLPSGVVCDTGYADAAVQADETVGLILPKPAHYLHPGASNCGNLVLDSLSAPRSVLDKNSSIEAIDVQRASSMLKIRPNDSHKGTYGKTLIVAGSEEMPGAAVLAARAAVRGGSGYVYLLDCGWHNCLDVLSEVLPIKMNSEGSRLPKAEAILNQAHAIGNFTALVIGPGLSTHSKALDAIRRIIQSWPAAIIMDADALMAFTDRTEQFKDLGPRLIITPHPGEMAQLTGMSIAEIQSDRIRTAKQAAISWGCTVVLKGAGTVIATNSGEIMINTSGNAGMAAAGSGDILAGLLGSLISQGYSLEDAAALGVFIHGAAGDCAARMIGPVGYTPSEVADYFPWVLKELKEEKMEGKKRFFGEKNQDIME